MKKKKEDNDEEPRRRRRRSNSSSSSSRMRRGEIERGKEVLKQTWKIKKSFTHLDLATDKTRQDRRRKKITTYLSRIRTRTLVGTHRLARQRNQANKPLNHPLPQKRSILLKSSAKSHHPTRVYICARVRNAPDYYYITQRATTPTTNCGSPNRCMITKQI
ncbi:hypothetical protein PoB_007256800 [Plakobranchus ocellatus]|uniref:Uncharacterized protein n=1 Tax=Plakobranchus ocellatus TaxID=259542 RepID=A0AAV4DP36_9GAST|nr:hypothetical protein PoB_007256800 [Plakobranchus ocellatus]